MDGWDGSPGGPRYRAPTVLINVQVQQTVAEKTSALEAEAFKTKRMQASLSLGIS